MAFSSSSDTSSGTTQQALSKGASSASVDAGEATLTWDIDGNSFTIENEIRLRWEKNDRDIEYDIYLQKENNTPVLRVQGLAASADPSQKLTGLDCNTHYRAKIVAKRTHSTEPGYHDDTEITLPVVEFMLDASHCIDQEEPDQEPCVDKFTNLNYLVERGYSTYSDTATMDGKIYYYSYYSNIGYNMTEYDPFNNTSRVLDKTPVNGYVGLSSIGGALYVNTANKNRRGGRKNICQIKY